MRGGWATLRVTIIAAVVTFAKLENTRSVNHLECKVFIILKVVEDHGVGLGEGLSLRGLKSSQDDGLLATQFCAGTVFGKDGEGIGAVMP